jgi:cobalt-zinc-cadmium efflux system outer membrane protein
MQARFEKCWTRLTASIVWLAVLGPLGTRAEEPKTLPPPTLIENAPEAALTLENAVNWGLANNPDLMALRQQHGIAAAGIIIAREYPFNPVYDNRIRPDTGPASAGITNRLAMEHTLMFQLEIRGQRKYRLQEAHATLSRTDWEIATQELAVGIHILRAFDTVLYRRQKLRLINETITLDQQIADRVAKLVEAGRLRSADLILARTEVDDARALLAPGTGLATTALTDLQRAMGLVDGRTELQGNLDRPVADIDADELSHVAMQRRPDLRSQQAAVAEAEARLRLTIANRFGNPTIGPGYEINETRVSFIGGQMSVPLPVFNRQRGEIAQKQAERSRTVYQLREVEISIRQDLHAAQVRLESARASVETYRNTVLPNLKKAMSDMQLLFNQGDPAVDVLRVIDVHRRYLRSQDGYLDALWELSQARADLAAAAGDPSIGFGTALSAECAPKP